MRKFTRSIAALAAISLFAVACGDDNGDDTAGDPTAVETDDTGDDDASDDDTDEGDTDDGDTNGEAADDEEVEVSDDLGDDAVGVDAGSADLLGAGASFITPVMLEWIRDNEPGIAVNYQSIGSGGGITQFLEETVDFGSTERYLTDEEVADAEEIRGCPAIHIPDAFGGVVPAYNNEDVDAALEAAGQDSLILSGEVLADIYLGNITDWDDAAIADLNPDVELPGGDIIPIHRSDGSGTTYIFVRYLADISAEWDDVVGYGSEVDWPAGIGGNGNEGVSAELVQQPGTIGYLSIAYALENDITMTSVINADDNAIYPTVDSVTAGPETIIDTIPDDFRYDILDVGGDGFPIVGTHWILAWECGYDDDVAQSLQEFLTWTVTEGDDLAEELLYSPVTGDFEDRVLDEIERINASN